MSHSFKFSKLLPRFLRTEKDKSISIDRERSFFSTKDQTCRVLLLDDADLLISVKGGLKGHLVLEQVFDHLNLLEKDYFGLRYLDYTGQNHWLEAQKSLSSQLKGCLSPVYLYFGVKFYPADPCKLKEEITRYQFFLQIKQDIYQGRLPINHNEAAEIFAYCLQSELGDFDPNRHTPGYVSEFCFIANQTEELEETIAAHHRRLIGQVPTIAEYKFLDKIKWLDMYGVDLHPVLGDLSTEYFLGLTPTGIVVYKNKTKVGNYFWPRITKVTYRGKIFITRVKDKNNDEHTYAFELVTKTAVKHLWKCCVEHHAFFSGRHDRLNQPEFSRQTETSVRRAQSKRQPRRTSSDPRLNAHMTDLSNQMSRGPMSIMSTPEAVKPPRHRSLPELQGRESPKSVHSAPWESNLDVGMYTSGRDSPLSMHSEMLRSHKRGGDSESGQRRKYFPSKKGSDNESDISSSRKRREAENGSESDISPAHHPRYSRTRSAGVDWSETQCKDATGLRVALPVKESQPNGSIPSVHLDPAAQARQKRARRRRSKSPSHRPPEELKQHIEFDLVEGLSEQQMREIPYISVETRAEPFKLQIAAKLKHRYRSPKRRSMGEADLKKPVFEAPADDPPPPYSPPKPDRPAWATHGRQHSATSGHHGNHADLVVKSSPSVYKYPAQQAPVVKTKPTNSQNYPSARIQNELHTHRNDAYREEDGHHSRHFEHGTHSDIGHQHDRHFTPIRKPHNAHKPHENSNLSQFDPSYQSHGEYQMREMSKSHHLMEEGRINGEQDGYSENKTNYPRNRSRGRSEVSNANRSDRDNKGRSDLATVNRTAASTNQTRDSRDSKEQSDFISVGNMSYGSDGRRCPEASGLNRNTSQGECNRDSNICIQKKNVKIPLEENNNWTAKKNPSHGIPENDSCRSSSKPQSPGRMFGTLEDINRMYTTRNPFSTATANRGQQSPSRSAFSPHMSKMSPPRYHEYRTEYGSPSSKSARPHSSPDAYCNNVPQLVHSPNTRKDYWTEL